MLLPARPTQVLGSISLVHPIYPTELFAIIKYMGVNKPSLPPATRLSAPNDSSCAVSTQLRVWWNSPASGQCYGTGSGRAVKPSSCSRVKPGILDRMQSVLLRCHVRNTIATIDALPDGMMIRIVIIVIVVHHQFEDAKSTIRFEHTVNFLIYAL